MNNGSESKIIDGRKLAKKIEREVKEDADQLRAQGVIPCLASILVGDDAASKLYISLKHRACDRAGILAKDYHLPSETSQGELTELIERLNQDDEVHAILVQLPLPESINEQEVMETIDPSKDADGFHPFNMGRLLIGNEGLVPCTPRGIIRALDEYQVNVEGKHAVVVGHSNVVGKPMAAMLLNRNATVSVCHVYTQDLNKFTSQADILIVATGVKHLIREDMVKEGSIIFDVGITEENGKIYGDVDYENVIERASLITPVPGGVGPVTVSILLEHVIKACRSSIKN
ncbi:Methylenetetrahydrofolate dehydrogenase (NADP(+)) [Methanosalsum zhilinae DSM 4017]|uniref:Bifunctional protein FolD n=2 Tax=Methanosalsum zhilinae TaxID=39669 RepID=F7XMS6_METZD|nr:Methylenetetrahydrofolate dehydrogenase (NADP(+)) [Methanosalsum zhilinae DSM 4017]